MLVNYPQRAVLYPERAQLVILSGGALRLAALAQDKLGAVVEGRRAQMTQSG